MRATVRIVPQEEIAKGTAEPPALRPPEPRSFFAARAARLRVLAGRQPAAGAYLELMASLSELQHAALAHGRDAPGWRRVLSSIVARLEPRLPGPSAALLRSLESASASYVENLADKVRTFDYPGADARLVPFVGAALQVEWVARVAMLGGAAIAGADISTCPVCASPPVASVLRADGPVPGSRYLHCALCGTEWHVPRGQCTHCSSREKLAYFHIEGGSETVKAEACDACRSYLKIVNREKDALADPAADDLASIALDLLMDEAGYQRAGPNLLFVPGQT